MVARWQPPHLGHAAILQKLCSISNQVFIGIGSSNTYNYRCPFKLEETSTMLKLVLRDFSNYTLIPVPDLHNGPKWRLMLKELFQELDTLFTANPYVASLMQADYNIQHPLTLLAPHEQIKVEGQMVRKKIAQNGNWQTLVTPEIADYIIEHQLDSRFRKEFGLQTLAIETLI
ncbi:MAG: hypothetical protein CVU39_17665 [Chloroflexi bacterium HGW-Chloroflexi-10]|nr:MAG: hypothetical protein CVU39_17665 [Chloroflexi bacterium HGW-Chloroflexi-10]